MKTTNSVKRYENITEKNMQYHLPYIQFQTYTIHLPTGAQYKRELPLLQAVTWWNCC